MGTRSGTVIDRYPECVAFPRKATLYNDRLLIGVACMRKLSLIDDDEGLAQPLRQYLARFDFALDSEPRPLAAIERLRERSYDAVVLDVMLPGIDGFETCRRIRRFSDVPIIMLTARGEVTDRVVGLEIGADDYLPKPFEPRELVARIQNILKRAQAVEPLPERLRIGALTVDRGRKRVTRGENPLPLTAAEFELLDLLLRRRGEVLSRDAIMHELRGIDADIYSRAIDVLVSRVRHKLEQPDLIRTVRGQGYQLLLP